MAGADYIKINLDDALSNTRKVKSLLDALYMEKDYASIRVKPVLNSLVDACEYMERNIEILIRNRSE